MLEVAKSNTGIKKKIATWAKQQSYQHHKDAMEGKNTNSLGYSIAKKAAFSKVQCFT